MLKTIALLSHMIGVLIIGNLVLPKDVKISHDLPTEAVAGETYWVYVQVDKQKVQGFAKFQMDVPEGFEIEPGDIKGGTFTFNEGAAKVIWMALPTESEFEISLKLRVLSTCPEGNHAVNQRFAYLEGTERKVMELDEHRMFIGSEDVSNAFVPDTLASGSRRITQLNGDLYLVEMDLYKDGIKGFAKIEERIPEGMSAEPVKKSNAVFTQLDNTVKFVWFSIPEQDSLTIVYELFTDAEDITDFQILGEFTYLKDNVSKTIALDTVEEEELITETTETEEEITEEVDTAEDTTTVEEEPEEIVEVEEVIEEVVEEQIEEVVTNIPAPDTGISYRVQIAAGKNVVDGAYFKKRHSFSSEFNIEHHESWVKYTTGDFDVYKQARDDRNRIRDNFNFDGPFVTAYNSGERITVQEALLISRQQWYQ